MDMSAQADVSVWNESVRLPENDGKRKWGRIWQDLQNGGKKPVECVKKSYGLPQRCIFWS